MSTQLSAELAEQWEGGREWEIGECSWMPGPMAGEVSHFSTYGDPMDNDYSVPTILCREKWWRVLTTRVQESKVDQWDRINYGVIPRSQFYRGCPRQTQTREDSNEENMENQDETQGQQPPQPWYCHNLSYWYRHSTRRWERNSTC